MSSSGRLIATRLHAVEGGYAYRLKERTTGVFVPDQHWQNRKRDMAEKPGKEFQGYSPLLQV